jgi:hypothetical protein
MRLRARKPRQNALAKSQGVFCFSTLTTETLPALSSLPRSLRDQSLQQNRPPPDRFAPRAVVIHCAGVEDLVVLPEFVNDPFWPAVLEPHRCRIAGWFSTGLFEVVFLTLAEIVINPCKVCRRSGVQTTEQSPVVHHRQGDRSQLFRSRRSRISTRPIGWTSMVHGRSGSARNAQRPSQGVVLTISFAREIRLILIHGLPKSSLPRLNSELR